MNILRPEINIVIYKFQAIMAIAEYLRHWSTSSNAVLPFPPSEAYSATCIKEGYKSNLPYDIEKWRNINFFLLCNEPRAKATFDPGYG